MLASSRTSLISDCNDDLRTSEIIGDDTIETVFSITQIVAHDFSLAVQLCAHRTVYKINGPRIKHTLMTLVLSIRINNDIFCF